MANRLDRAYDQARQLIATKAQQVRRLAEAVLARKQLSLAEIEALMAMTKTGDAI